MQWVDEPNGLAAVCERLAEASTFFIDTEFESNRRGKVLSLIQLSDGEGDVYVIDALTLLSESPTALVALGQCLLSQDSTWVLHAGLQDVELLLPAFRAKHLPAIFDTQIGWALTSPESGVSLAYLVFRGLGIRCPKAYQADDWMRRPLPPKQVLYAASDIEHLPALYDSMSDVLSQLDREEIALAASREAVQATVTLPTRLSVTSFRNAWQLEPQSQAALIWLIDWYNDHGEQSGLNSKTLLSIASRLPRDRRDLGRIKGVGRGLVERHGQTLVTGMSRAARGATDAEHPPLDPPAYATYEGIQLDAWLIQMRATLSCELRVAPDLVLPNRLLSSMSVQINEARGDKRAGVAALSGWRQDLARKAYETYCVQHG